MSSEPTFSLKLDPVGKRRETLTYTLSICAAGRTVWPVLHEPEHPVEIQLDDLFAYLVEFWKPLCLRQAYPLALSPTRPSFLARDAARRWEDLPQEQIDEEASAVDSFEEAHELSHAFGGLFDLPQFWLVREGDAMIVDAGRTLERLPVDNVLSELAQVGNWMAGRLLEAAPDRYDRIVDAWRHRDESNSVDLVAWAASLTPAVAGQLIDAGLIDPPGSFAEAANDNNELLIAARMAGALPTDQIFEILALARGLEFHDASALDECSVALLAYLEAKGDLKPFSAGEMAANFLRDRLGIGPSEFLDIFDVAQRLGIEVKVGAVGPSTFDGLAIAGPRFGPGAFINTESKRVRDKTASDPRRDPGVRITLAHELCHLLLDRQHSLSAVEVLRSRMPAMVESRAKSFAGELLLPTSTAGSVWDQAHAPQDRGGLEAILQELAERYRVSYSVAGWKLEHGARERSVDLEPMLDVLIPYR